MVTNELTFYLAAVVLVVLTVESCIKLLNRNSFGITLVVYVTVFAWYFVDPFINPEQYDYLPSSLLGESYGQVLLFLIGFRLFIPVAMRWILRRRSSAFLIRRLDSRADLSRRRCALVSALCPLASARMGGDVMAAVFPLDGRAGPTMWGRGAVESSGERISDLPSPVICLMP